jgi:Tfp pilus assembly protein FimT
MKQIVKVIAILLTIVLLALPIFGQMGERSMMREKAEDMMNRGQEM